MKHQEFLVCSTSSQLMEEVYTILDSRIQYMEYQAHKQYNFQKIDAIQASDQNSKEENAASLISNFDTMLVYLQELNHSLKLLQILKSWLKDDNAQQIFKLLCNKSYLNYTEESLEDYLKKEAVLEQY